MAYGIKYSMGSSFIDGPTGFLVEVLIAIHKKDYAGGVTELKGVFDSFALNREYTVDGLEQNILGLNLEFAIQRSDEDFFLLHELLTATERQFYIEVQYYVAKQFIGIAFQGFINVENTEQKYLQFQSISLVASSYLSKLSNYSPSILDSLEKSTLIDTIISMLSELGSTSDIRVNCSLLPEEDFVVQTKVIGQPGFTAFNKAGFFTELFWDNNVEKQSSYTILNEIMKSMDCYIYWFDDKWYIERYNDIWDASGTKWFVEYDITQSYGTADPGVWRSEDSEVNNLHQELLFTNETKLLRGVPGLRQIAVKINDKRFDNLVPSKFLPLVFTSQLFPDTDPREWYANKIIAGYTNWADIDVPFKDIERGIKKTHSDPIQFPVDGSDYVRGLYCSFRVTIKDETKLNLSWKYNVGEDATAWIEPGFGAAYFTQYWALRFISEETGSDVVFLVDETAENKGYYLADIVDAPLAGLAMERIKFSQEDFDQKTRTYQATVSIPLNEINELNNTNHPVTLPLRGDFVCQLIIGEVVRKGQGILVGPQYDGPLKDPRFGDVEVTTSGDSLDDNYIEGTINTDFLNKKVIDITLADQSDLNYVNGILRGTDLNSRTTNWQDSNTDTPRPLADRLLENKFRFYNVTRQKVVGNIKDVLLWRPLSLFVDEKQSDLKFIMLGNQQRLSIAAYDVILQEYDNETEVNLIEEA